MTQLIYQYKSSVNLNFPDSYFIVKLFYSNWNEQVPTVGDDFNAFSIEFECRGY